MTRPTPFSAASQLTLIERVSSGFPVPLIDSFNGSGTTFNAGGNDNNFNRPDQVSGCNPYKAEPRPASVDQLSMLYCPSSSGVE